MRINKYKSAVHNFSYSFQSIDHTRSGKIAINGLIKLRNLGFSPKMSFNFITKQIEPKLMCNEWSLKLLNDYLDWLPEHFKNQNCDIAKVIELRIEISANFEDMNIPYGLNDTKNIQVITNTYWKIERSKMQHLEISKDELIKFVYLKNGLIEF